MEAITRLAREPAIARRAPCDRRSRAHRSGDRGVTHAG